MPINNTLCYCFGRLNLILKTQEFRSIYFIRFLFNFIVICSRATSIWYQSITSIRDQVISPPQGLYINLGILGLSIRIGFVALKPILVFLIL